MKLMTGQERKAIAIGKALTKALLQIESFDGDPEMILDEVEINLSAKPPMNIGVMGAVDALKKHYRGESNE